jgi:predicted dehydrogenase/threonine dehydrogenase-like Zn-dependent dehydrogenase
MLQIIQYQKNGKMLVEELPAPKMRSGWILVQNMYSLISSGTERTSVETAQASIIGKAKSRPDLVRQVVDNAKKEGLSATYKKVKSRLDNYKELGYSCSGIVLESSVDEFKQGDRVACAGSTANHSEIISVPKNLAVKIPSMVSFEEAAFTTIGSISMQGVRQAEIRLGEKVAVIGLGLIGLITIQLLKANGCKVIGLDINDHNFELAEKFGCDECILFNADSIKRVETFTKGHGTDAVLITASTQSNEPVELALQYAMKKSKIVIVGVTGMNIPRSQFYEKEIDFRISCSYGPGRYDSMYEEKGIDYPIGYVRWTEKRNMESILTLLDEKKLNFKTLITHKIPIKEGLRAYDIITGKIKEKYNAILIEYSKEIKKISNEKSKIILNNPINSKNDIKIGFIGAGNFAQSYLIPPLKKSGVSFVGLVTARSINAKTTANKFKFNFASTEKNDIFNNKKINTIFIATRHDSHAKYVVEGIKSGKNIFCEKPLAINDKQLDEIEKAIKQTNFDKQILVGFNRRFSKCVRSIKNYFTEIREPLIIHYRVNAGFIPLTHWTQDVDQGGRIIGEGCHFIDTMIYLTNSMPISVFAQSIKSENSQINSNDSVSITIQFNSGSIGNLLYLANGDSSVPKEYCEVYGGNRTVIMKNFKTVEFYKNNKMHKEKYDGKKGHDEEIEYFINRCLGKVKQQLTLEEIMATTRTTFRIIESLNKNQLIEV